MKYYIGVYEGKAGGDESSICIDFNNDISVTYAAIREHIYPHMKNGIFNITAINCNDVIYNKLLLVIEEYNENNPLTY